MGSNEPPRIQKQPSIISISKSQCTIGGKAWFLFSTSDQRKLQLALSYSSPSKLRYTYGFV